jgi:hypothetical protein
LVVLPTRELQKDHRPARRARASLVLAVNLLLRMELALIQSEEWLKKLSAHTTERRQLANHRFAPRVEGPYILTLINELTMFEFRSAPDPGEPSL